MFNIPIVVQDQVGGVHVGVVDKLGGEEDSEGEYSEEKKSHSERETNGLPVFFLLTQNGPF